MNSARSGRRMLAVASAIGAGLSLARFAPAANYTWNVLNSGNASGSWGVVANWNPNLNTATTAADTVFFNAQDITADSVISLNAPQIIGRNFPAFPDNSIVFGDTNTATAAGWTINATSSTANDNTNILTLEAGNTIYEIVKVNELGAGKVATINAQLSNGAAGGLALAKAGAGTLVLTAANANLTGSMAVNNGVLMLDFSQAWSPTTNILGDSGTAGASSSNLELQGGSLILRGKSGAANSQSFTNGTGLELGQSKISFVQNGATSVSVNLGPITRNAGGVMDIALPASGAVTWSAGTGGGAYPSLAIGTAAGTNGLLVDTNGSAYATVNGGTDWAADSAGSVVAGSSVGGFYTASTATSLSGNADLVTSPTLAAPTSVASLRMNDPTARTINLATNTLSAGGILITPGAGPLVILNGNLSGTSTNAGADLIVHHNGTTPLTISANITDAPGGASVLTKTGDGMMVLNGNNTYTGNTILNGGTTVVSSGSTGTTGAGAPETNIEVAPAYGNTATLTVANGTVNADRLIVGGNSGNFAGGHGTVIQTGGVINSGQWMSFGTQGDGTFLMLGGVANQNAIGGTQMEVGVFGIGRGTVSLSGNAQLNILNNGNITMGVFDTASGTFNQNGGAVTFFSDAGTTMGGSGNLIIGNDAGASVYTLSAGTLTVGGISHGGTGTGVLNLNGGTIKSARNGASLITGLTAARVQAGGAVIDSNGNTATVASPLVHDPALGATPDGGFRKNGSGTIRLGAASTYTGATVISSGTLQLVNTAGVPQAVGNYSFDNVRDTNNNLVTSGSLNDNYTVVNGGTGGATMNGRVNNDDNILGPGNPGGSIVPGRFGNGISLDGLGSSVDIASQIVDQSSGNVSSMNLWLNTTTPGGLFVGKNTGGVTWALGHSAFYLGDTAANGRPPGQFPTAVRFAGGFEQTATPVADGNWHMLTYVDTGSGKQIYVDGVLAALNESDFNGIDTSTFVRLGFNIDSFANLDGTVHYAGTMDELTFFSSALTAQQIQELFTTNTITTANMGGQFLPTATPVNITAAGAALDLNGVNQTIGSLAGVAGSIVSTGGGTLTTGGNNTSTTFAGVISGAGGLVKTGGGAFTLSGVNTYTGPTVASAGTLIVGNAARISAGPLIANGGTASFASGAATAHKVASLSITAGAVDMNDNDLVVGNATPKSAVVSVIASARNGGAWNGSGLTSSAARTQANHATTLGALSGAEFTSVGGAGTFSGQSYAAGDTLVKYTWYGDSDFNGVVNFDDYVRTDNGFNNHLSGWLNGDFDGNSAVNFDDYVLIDLAFNTQSGTLRRALGFLDGSDRSMQNMNDPALQKVADHFAEFGDGYARGLLAAVPEPATLALLGVPALAAMARRRRKA